MQNTNYEIIVNELVTCTDPVEGMYSFFFFLMSKYVCTSQTDNVPQGIELTGKKSQKTQNKNQKQYGHCMKKLKVRKTPKAFNQKETKTT